MSNVNAPYGARWIGHARGMPITGCQNSYIVLATDATALFVGDFVKLAGSAALDSANIARPTVVQAAATDTIVGVVAGFEADPSYDNQLYRTASTKRIVYVIDDPDALFTIQGYAAAFAADDTQLNADIYTGVSGDTTSGNSGMQINLTAPASATAQLRIMRLADNSQYGLYAQIAVYINEHAYRGTTGV